METMTTWLTGGVTTFHFVRHQRDRGAPRSEHSKLTPLLRTFSHPALARQRTDIAVFFFRCFPKSSFPSCHKDTFLSGCLFKRKHKRGRICCSTAPFARVSLRGGDCFYPRDRSTCFVLRVATASNFQRARMWRLPRCGRAKSSRGSWSRRARFPNMAANWWVGMLGPTKKSRFSFCDLFKLKPEGPFPEFEKPPHHLCVRSLCFGWSWYLLESDG